jgi:hypothetical protein
MLDPSRRMTCMETPASEGSPGPGEITMCEGCMAGSSDVTASFGHLHIAAQFTDVLGQVEVNSRSYR